MMTNLLAQMSIDDTAWVKSYDIQIAGTIEDLGIEVEITPFWERGKKLSNIEVALLKICEERLQQSKQYYADGNWNFVEISPYVLMIKTIEMFYSALDKASKENWKVFHLNTKEISKEKVLEQIEKKKKRVDKISKNVDSTTEQSITDVVINEIQSLRNIIATAPLQPTQYAQSIPLQQNNTIETPQKQHLETNNNEYEEEIVPRKVISIWGVSMRAG